MTAPMRPAPRVLTPQTPEERELASVERRRRELSDQKLDTAMEQEAKEMLLLHCEKVTERVARFKALTMFLAVKNKIGPVWGEALDEKEEAS